MIELDHFDAPEEPCPYLPNRNAMNETRIVLRVSPGEYERELENGWRLFGPMLFRPRCTGCQECVSLRIPVSRFTPSRSQRRVRNKNRDIQVEVGEPVLDEERFALFLRFHEERTENRGWPQTGMDPEDYESAFVVNSADTLEFRYRLEGQLIAIAYVGRAQHSLNSIYAFYDPDHRSRSLGTFDVLSEIEFARQHALRYVYLGFRVEGCSSMAYKALFRPHETLGASGWTERLG